MKTAHLSRLSLRLYGRVMKPEEGEGEGENVWIFGRRGKLEGLFFFRKKIEKWVENFFSSFWKKRGWGVLEKNMSRTTML